MIKELTMEKTDSTDRWDEMKMVDACEILTCGVASTPKYVDEEIGIPFLSAQNVRDGEVVLNKYKYISKEFHEKLTSKNKPTKGDLLYSRVGAKYGEAGVVEHNFEFSVYVSVTLIRAKKEILNNYFLKHYLNSPRIKELAKQSITSSGVPNLNVKSVREFPVPIPPLNQQKQIVGILDKAFAAIDTAKANAEQNLQNAKELFESYFQNIFENKGDDWKLVPFGQVCEISGGSQPPKDNFIYEPREGYVRLVQVRDYRTDKYITYIPINKAKKFCKADDIMIGRYGPPIFGIFSGIEGAYNVALMKAIPNESIINKEYIRWFLKTPNIVKFVEKTSKRAAGQDGVRKERLYEYNIPVPAFPEQKKIVETLDKLSLEIKKLEAIYTQKIADLEEMKKAILEKAFSGQLGNIN